jgi:cardiolipin synthase
MGLWYLNAQTICCYKKSGHPGKPLLSQIPNLLTLLRIGAAPVMVVLLRDQSYQLAFLVFLLAGISDGLDGYLAKRFNWISRLGAALDPVADKMLIISAFVMLALLDRIPFALLVAVAFRDLLIIGGYIMLVTLNGNTRIQPSLISKLNTFLLISLICLVLTDLAQWLSLLGLIELLVWAVGVTTIWSGIHYAWVFGVGREAPQEKEKHPLSPDRV